MVSHQFECPGEGVPVDTLLSEGVVEGALSWDIEWQVEKVGQELKVAFGCPVGWLFIP